MVQPEQPTNDTQPMEHWFRGKAADGHWEYGGINDKGDCIISYHQFIPVDPKTVGMKLPIFDVYHRGIYPGDVLKYWVADKRLLVIVGWTGWRFTFTFHPDSEVGHYPDDFVISHSRIVGNIWDGIE